MKKETLIKGEEIQKKIVVCNQRISELNNVIKEKNNGSVEYLTFGSPNNRVFIYDGRILDIFISILQSDFQDKLKKAEQELADLKD